ncbi:hypothetical protein RCL1_007226 [Eukaryota sp. TZLM3-RCL]
MGNASFSRPCTGPASYRSFHSNSPHTTMLKAVDIIDSFSPGINPTRSTITESQATNSASVQKPDVNRVLKEPTTWDKWLFKRKRMRRKRPIREDSLAKSPLSALSPVEISV